MCSVVAVVRHVICTVHMMYMYVYTCMCTCRYEQPTVGGIADDNIGNKLLQVSLYMLVAFASVIIALSPSLSLSHRQWVGVKDKDLENQIRE